MEIESAADGSVELTIQDAAASVACSGCLVHRWPAPDSWTAAVTLSSPHPCSPATTGASHPIRCAGSSATSRSPTPASPTPSSKPPASACGAGRVPTIRALLQCPNREPCGRSRASTKCRAGPGACRCRRPGLHVAARFATRLAAEWWVHVRHSGTEFVERFLREELGWDQAPVQPLSTRRRRRRCRRDHPPRRVPAVRVGRTNPLYPIAPDGRQEAPGAEGAPRRSTISTTRR